MPDVPHHHQPPKPSETTDAKPWESLDVLAMAGDAERLEAFIATLAPGESARAISRLDSHEQCRVLTTLTPGNAANLLEECPPAQATELIEQLAPQQAAAIIAELPSDHQADLITTLDDADRQAILREMGSDEAAAVTSLAQYPATEAGGLMITEFLSFPETTRVAAVLDDLRSNAETYADYDVQYAYCTSAFGELVGVLRLRDLLLTPSAKPINDVMIRKPFFVRLDTSLQQLHDLFEDRSFYGVPVVDEGGRLQGVVRRGDVEQAITNRAESDYLKSQGIIGGEELRTMPLRIRASRRLSWLSLNILLNLVSASVIAAYQDTLASVIALAVFLPIISDMSGCAGNQAVAVSMRELTLGMIKPFEVLRVWTQELSVGLINGLVLGVLVSLVAIIWKGNYWLGAVVGCALALNTLVAVTVGGALPLILKMLKRDPALASGPILTTVTDMCGFFLVLSFASAVLPRLTSTQ